MWLVEKEPSTNEDLIPINLDNVMYFTKDENDSSTKFAIQFMLNLCDYNGSKAWIKWWFSSKETRDEWHQKILSKLPRLDIGVDQILI